MSSNGSKLVEVLGGDAWPGVLAGTLAPAGAALWVLVLERSLPLLAPEESGSLGATEVLTLLGGFTIIVIAMLVVVGAVIGAETLAGRAGWKWPHLWAPVVAGVLVAGPMVWVGDALASGDWIKEQWFAPAVRWGPAGAAAAGMAVLAWVLLRFRVDDDGPSWRRHGLTGALWGTTLVLGVADVLVMPGLHPQFHLVLLGLMSLFALLAAWRTIRTLLPRPTRRTALAMGLPALALIIGTVPLWLLMGGRVRAELVQGSAMATNIIRQLSSGSGPDLRGILEDLDVSAGRIDAASGRTESRLALGDDWNIILVTVDTLRADTLPPARRPNQPHAVESDTPFFNDWVGRTFRFEHAYSQSTMTHRSLPAAFRSLEVFENPELLGAPLGVAMAGLGRTPVAVVNNFFLEPRFKRIQQLLEGFEQIEAYEKFTMHTMVDQASELLGGLKDTPFFAWIHFYNMHHPGFDGKHLGEDGATWRTRYQRSLRWLDEQMGRLVAELDRIGIAERTVIIFTSDHGEGLGDNGVQTHGPNVLEEEVRVPIFIFIPGREGHAIEATISNIDIVPTIYELLGAEPNPQHRGESLVPLVLDADADWDRDYYLENASGKQVALVSGDNKLIYDLKAGVELRFDVEDDPKEERNLFDSEGILDQLLMQRLIQRNPKKFSETVANEDVQNLLLDRLSEVDARKPGEALEFLLRLTALEPRDRSVDEGERVFTETDDEAVRLLVLRHLFDVDKERFERLLAGHLEQLAGTAGEHDFVMALSMQGQPPFDHKLVTKRMGHFVAAGELDATLPWLRLSKAWKNKPAKAYGKVLRRVLEAGAERPPAEAADVLETALEVVASLGRGSRKSPTTKALVHASRPLVEHPEVRVRRAAIFAMAQLRDKGSVRRLERALANTDEDVRVRQAALHALAGISGKDAVEAISEAGKDLLLTVDAIKAIKAIRSPEGVPFLEWVMKNHYNRLVKGRAKKAKASIANKQRKQRKPKKQPKTPPDPKGNDPKPGK